MDQNEVGRLETCAGVGLCASLVEGLEAQSCRLLAGRPTRTEENPGTGAGQERRHLFSPVLEARRRENQHDPFDGGMAEKRFHRPDGEWPARKREKLLWRLRSAEAAASAGGDHDRTGAHFGLHRRHRRSHRSRASPSARTATSSSRAGHSAEWIPFGFRTA